MKIFHKLFDSHQVKIGPTVISSYRNQIGRIFFYPSECNSFINDYSCVGIYDNGDISIPNDIGKLLDYTCQHDEFIPYCVGIWNVEVWNKGNNRLAISQLNGDVNLVNIEL